MQKHVLDAWTVSQIYVMILEGEKYLKLVGPGDQMKEELWVSTLSCTNELKGFLSLGSFSLPWKSI